MEEENISMEVVFLYEAIILNGVYNWQTKVTVSYWEANKRKLSNVLAYIMNGPDRLDKIL